MKTQNQSRLLSAASLALSIAIVAGATAAFSGPGEASGAYNAYVAETAAAEITEAAAPQYLEKTASINAADGIDADEAITKDHHAPQNKKQHTPQPETTPRTPTHKNNQN